ncbi:cell division initiation protein [Microbacterium sp. X-17]|uniref:cell division initiation protein n=1 Tax=Microbacterium sp. X-17 TaxID=3144404 RepID=UPI0031F55F68
MSDSRNDSSPFEQLMQSASDGSEGTAFTVGFRGYDRHEVDTAIAELTTRLQRSGTELAALEGHYRDALERSATERQETVDRLQAEQEDAIARLQSELSTAKAQAAEAEQRLAAVGEELAEVPADGDDEGPSRQQFEAVLRVAEEQANVLIQNAAVQAERLIAAAREEIAGQRTQLDADVVRITAQAQHDADQVRLRVDTEYTAHQARIEREAAHAAEKVSQAEQEAATIRSEAEKGAAALRSMVTRETTEQRTEAERDVREMNARVLEFEETLTRRQDDAQQEFLVLHNQAVAHAERITNDANEQVAGSLAHAQRISAKADDYERLMRAQAQQIEADAQVKARETLDRARTKAQKIVDSVTSHTTGVLRDAEDRTRQLRWQQQQLTSFMAEVRELIRPEGLPAPEPADLAADPEAEPATEAPLEVE